MFVFTSSNGGFSGKISELVKLLLYNTNPGIIAAHVVSSISVIIFIVYFFWKPTNKFINQQKEKLDKVHTSLSQATKETKQALTTLQKEQEEFVAERKRFLRERKEKEKLILKQRMEEAEKAKQEIISEAQKKIQLMEEEAKRTVNQKIITLSVELAEKLIRGTINQKTQSKIIDGYLDELDTVFKGARPEAEDLEEAIKKS